MYRALYRKWRPQRFEDVVGQEAIVSALQNQILAGRIGHAYMFTGTRGTGKTTCAKIFAKAVNCPEKEGADPCCQCTVCKGIDDGSILDVMEIDAASNNGVDNIRDLRDESVYAPSICQYKVYIIDEVHMLSSGAFNALLKTLEEPPSHVIFILATTEIHKVPVTILSRCQRYDFGRIAPEAIAKRLAYVAQQENIDLQPAGAALIARLADGAMRDALSILDTCAGVAGTIDEEIVRRMSGVTDKSYLFRVSDALTRQDAVAALEEVAQLRQQSVDVRRLAEELINHYRNLMLSGLPGGVRLLGSISPEEEAQYQEQCQHIPQAACLRAIQTLGDALNRMGRGTDQRIELELALFSLAQAPAAPSVPVQAVAAQPFASTPVTPRTADATKSTAPALAPYVPGEQPAAKPGPVRIEPTPWENQPMAQAPIPEKPAATAKPAPKAEKLRAKIDPPEPFVLWGKVLEGIDAKQLHAMSTSLRGTKAYCDGSRILIDCSELAREFLKSKENKSAVEQMKDIIEKVSGTRYGIGPYTAPKADQPDSGEEQQSAEEYVNQLQEMGLPVVFDPPRNATS